MNPARFFRPVLFLVVLALSPAPVSAGLLAHNPLRGEWVAEAPLGITTYCFKSCHCHQHDKNCVIGRFAHSYCDCYGGIVVLHGTWILHSDGAGGTLELHFDNNIHLTDIAYTGNGLLPLWNAGIGKALPYGRVH
jgi:hypothetical protein